jgi:LuxR family maltose regulon positive regulatory protein
VARITDKKALEMPEVVAGELFTDRELEILKQIFSGSSTSDVALSLKISKRTVDFHLAKVYAKMDVKSRYDAYKKAVKLGIITG